MIANHEQPSGSGPDYKSAAGISFSDALAWLKANGTARRKIWPRGETVTMVRGVILRPPGADNGIDGIPGALFVDSNDADPLRMDSLPYFALTTASGAAAIGWLPTLTDLLAHDWFTCNLSKAKS